MKSGCGATRVSETRSPARSFNASRVSSPATPPPTMTTRVPVSLCSLFIADADLDLALRNAIATRPA